MKDLAARAFVAIEGLLLLAFAAPFFGVAILLWRPLYTSAPARKAGGLALIVPLGSGVMLVAAFLIYRAMWRFLAVGGLVDPRDFRRPFSRT